MRGGEAARGRGTTAKGVALVFSQVLPVMAIVSLFPAIPKLMQHFAGHPDAGLLVPMIVTVPSLCIALISPFAGIVADRFGRRPAFVGALAIYCVAGLAPLVLDDLFAIVASRAVLGLAEATIITVSSALIGDYFDEDRHRWVAWVGAVTSIAGALLLMVGGALADISWRGPFVIYALAIPSFILAFLVIDEPLEKTGTAHAVRAGFPWREAAIIGLVTATASICYYVEPLHIATLLLDKGAGSLTRIGVIQGLTSLAYIVGAFVYRRFHRLTIGQLLGIAGVLIGAGLVLVALSPSWEYASAAAAVQQLGAGMVIPSLLAWGQARLPIEQRGRGMGIWATAFFGGLFVCPPLVGLAGTAAGGLQPAFLVFGAITLVLGAAAPFLLRARQVEAGVAA